jgi:hypothetical protein
MGGISFPMCFSSIRTGGQLSLSAPGAGGLLPPQRSPLAGNRRMQEARGGLCAIYLQPPCQGPSADLYLPSQTAKSRPRASPPRVASPCNGARRKSELSRWPCQKRGAIVEVGRHEVDPRRVERARPCCAWGRGNRRQTRGPAGTDNLRPGSTGVRRARQSRASAHPRDTAGCAGNSVASGGCSSGRARSGPGNPRPCSAWLGPRHTRDGGDSAPLRSRLGWPQAGSSLPARLTAAGGRPSRTRAWSRSRG